LLAHAAERWTPRPPLAPLAGALACLALAALARQNGLLLVAAAGGVLAWTARGAGWRASLAWGLGGLVAIGVLAAAIDRIAQPAPNPKPGRGDVTRLILEHYDV